jgi:hypothetical protein
VVASALLEKIEVLKGEADKRTRVHSGIEEYLSMLERLDKVKELPEYGDFHDWDQELGDRFSRIKDLIKGNDELLKGASGILKKLPGCGKPSAIDPDKFTPRTVDEWEEPSLSVGEAVTFDPEKDLLPNERIFL